MAPMALFADDLDLSGTPAPASDAAAPAPAASGQVLVVSSQDAAQDGSYQALVSELAARGKVDPQMVDRIVEGGASLALPA